MNFICSYKSPKSNNFQYISALKNFVLPKNLNKPLFIIGDLNIDLLKDQNGQFCSDKGAQLNEMCEIFKLKFFVKLPTRIAHYKNKLTNNIRTSISLIDVVLHNNELISDVVNIDCPFSDQKFVVIAINSKTCVEMDFTMTCRNLSEKNMSKIVDTIAKINFHPIKTLKTVNEKYAMFASLLL